MTTKWPRRKALIRVVLKYLKGVLVCQAIQSYYLVMKQLTEAKKACHKSVWGKILEVKQGN